MKAMILAAGGGTRLYPLTFTIPKPMAPVLNRPVMEHIIKHMKKFGFTDYMINLHNLAEHIENYFQDGSKLGVNINYSHEATPLGTAGGVKNVEHFFDETFMVSGGDDLHDIDLGKLIEFHKSKKALATIGLCHEENVSQFGVVVTDENDRIVGFQEKPKASEAKSHWVNNGLYIFEPEIFEYIPKGKFYDFGSQLFPLLRDKGLPFYGYKCKGYWKDIGNLNDYRNVHIDCLTGKIDIEFPGKEVAPGVWAEKNVEISDKAEIKGPVIIGKECKISDGVRIEGPVVLGKYNNIKEGAQISRSVIWNYNNIDKNVKIDECLVGNECDIDEDREFSQTVIGSGMNDIFEDYISQKCFNFVPIKSSEE